MIPTKIADRNTNIVPRMKNMSAYFSVPQIMFSAPYPSEFNNSFPAKPLLDACIPREGSRIKDGSYIIVSHKLYKDFCKYTKRRMVFFNCNFDNTSFIL